MESDSHRRVGFTTGCSAGRAPKGTPNKLSADGRETFRLVFERLAPEGSAAKAAWVPRVAGLKPYPDETNGMSLAGYLRYALHLIKISHAEARRLIREQSPP